MAIFETKQRWETARVRRMPRVEQLHVSDRPQAQRDML